MIGTQNTPYWVTCGNSAERATRKERFIKITMPWRRRMYDIFTDTFGSARPQFSIYWYRPARTALVIRIGWAALFERDA